MGRKPFTISEYENDWSGFLFDLDAKDSTAVQRTFVPGETTSRTKDIETVHEARDAGRTVVTSNGHDFVRFTIDCQSRENNESCEDCWGLVIIPNKQFDRENALKKADVKRGIRIDGELLPWKAVAYANLCVRITQDGKINVSRFERCQFCEKAYPLASESWYKGLPVAQQARRPNKLG